MPVDLALFFAIPDPGGQEEQWEEGKISRSWISGLKSEPGIAVVRLSLDTMVEAQDKERMVMYDCVFMIEVLFGDEERLGNWSPH